MTALQRLALVSLPGAAARVWFVICLILSAADLAVRDLGSMARPGFDREHCSLYSEHCLLKMKVVHRTD
jgi:hypothetical protein